MKFKKLSIVLFVFLYIGVAVGGYVYFYVTNPIRKIDAVITQEQANALQTEVTGLIVKDTQAVVNDGSSMRGLPAMVAGIPVEENAREQYRMEMNRFGSMQRDEFSYVFGEEKAPEKVKILGLDETEETSPATRYINDNSNIVVDFYFTLKVLDVSDSAVTNASSSDTGYISYSAQIEIDDETKKVISLSMY
ncbi:hypothetical protein [Timonella sp. A28]|uniref:hypothetical protein n=1 Tax=Timonella sp. A28 TaxID=3442640 RepID=UPI003EB80B0D